MNHDLQDEFEREHADCTICHPELGPQQRRLHAAMLRVRRLAGELLS